MKRLSRLGFLALITMGLASCEAQYEPGARYDAAAPVPAMEMADVQSVSAKRGAQDGGAPSGGNQPPAGLQAVLAYVYDYSFSLPSEQVKSVADTHAKACADAGPSRCQVLQASSNTYGEDNVNATVRLRAEPEWLKGYSERVVADVDAAKGSVTGQSVTAEDLTTQIIDTGARMKALTTLRGRLEDLLATRDGKLADLLETERELARVQGELDATKARLASLQARVSMSIVTLNYRTKRSAVSGSAFEPVSEALGEAVSVFAMGLGAVIYFIAGALPFVLFLGIPLFFAIRWAWRRRRARRRVASEATESPPAA